MLRPHVYFPPYVLQVNLASPAVADSAMANPLPLVSFCGPQYEPFPIRIMYTSVSCHDHALFNSLSSVFKHYFSSHTNCNYTLFSSDVTMRATILFRCSYEGHYSLQIFLTTFLELPSPEATLLAMDETLRPNSSGGSNSPFSCLGNTHVKYTLCTSRRGKTHTL